MKTPNLETTHCGTRLRQTAESACRRHFAYIVCVVGVMMFGCSAASGEKDAASPKQKVADRNAAVKTILEAKASVFLEIGAGNFVSLSNIRDFEKRVGGKTITAVTRITFDRNSNITDAVMRHISGLNELETLKFNVVHVTDDQLENLAGLKNLKTLFLGGTGISDEGIKHISEVTQLSTLRLSSTAITDKGLAHIKGLKGLRSLSLTNTQVSDAGLVHLKGLNTLGVIQLANTNITDAGLVHLKQLPGLYRLNLAGTKITDSGLLSLAGNRRITQVFVMNTAVTEVGAKKFEKSANGRSATR